MVVHVPASQTTLNPFHRNKRGTGSYEILFCRSLLLFRSLEPIGQCCMEILYSVTSTSACARRFVSPGLVDLMKNDWDGYGADCRRQQESFVATHAGNLYALDARSGDPRWRSGAGAFLHSPACADGAVIAASSGGYRTPSGSQQRNAPLEFLCAGHGGFSIANCGEGKDFHRHTIGRIPRPRTRGRQTRLALEIRCAHSSNRGLSGRPCLCHR